MSKRRQRLTRPIICVAQQSAQRKALQEHAATLDPPRFIKPDSRRKVFTGRHRWHNLRPKILRAHRICLGCGRSDAPLRLFHLHPAAPMNHATRANTIPLCVPCDTKLRHYLDQLGAPQDHAPEVWVTLFNRDLESARAATRWIDKPRKPKGWHAKRGRPGWSISADEIRRKMAVQAAG